MPSEAFARALAGASAGDQGPAWQGTAALAAQLAVFYALSLALWRRLVGQPDTASGKRGAVGRPLPALRLPGLGATAAAVAWAQVRGSWRTVQGRLALAIPALTLAVLTFVFRRPEVLQEHLFGLAAGGPMLVLVAIFLALVGQQAVVLNQFAVDGTGLSLEFLGPLSDRDLLRGKAAGGAILTACSLIPALLAAAFLGGGASPWLWPAALLACLGTYAVLAPISAWLSILLPKAVDLSRLGRKGKPHQGAAIACMMILPFALGAAGRAGRPRPAGVEEPRAAARRRGALVGLRLRRRLVVPPPQRGFPGPAPRGDLPHRQRPRVGGRRPPARSPQLFRGAAVYSP